MSRSMQPRRCSLELMTLGKHDRDDEAISGGGSSSSSTSTSTSSVTESDSRPAKFQRLDLADEIKKPLTQPEAEDDRNTFEHKPAGNHIQVFSWNINGIAPFLQPALPNYFHRSNGAAALVDRPQMAADSGQRLSLRNFLKRHGWPQILNLQEVKVSPNDEDTKRRVQHAVNHCFSGADDGPRYTAHFCLPCDRYNATGFGRKVYGVVTVVRDDFLQDQVINVREVDWDCEGRVLVLETKTRLSIWNLYCVNGTFHAYKDSSTGRAAGTRHDRKLAFHRLLADECSRLEQSGWRLVLTGDFNVAPNHIDAYPKLRETPEQHVRNRADFKAKFFETLQLVDAFRHLHPNRRCYSWIAPNRKWLASCDRVDLCLVSRSLVENDCALYSSEVLMDREEQGSSDHVPISVALRLPGPH